jgi:hypothetical protein
VIETAESRAPAWQRRPGESQRAFQAADLYIQMGPGRSLAATAGKLGKNVSLLERWSKRWEWVYRAGEYDDHIGREERDAARNKALERAAELRRRDEEREEQRREKLFQIEQKLLSKADKMLDVPLTSIIHSDGKTIVTPPAGS